MELVFENIGIVALVLYFLSAFFFKKHTNIWRTIVSLLFGLMFMNCRAYAPMVLYFASVVTNLIPVNFYVQFGQKHPILRYLLWNVLPSGVAIAVAFLVRVPGEDILLFILPTVAIGVNLLFGAFTTFGKRSSVFPFIRSAVWMLYFAMLNIYIGIIYELVNVLMYTLLLIYRRKNRQASLSTQAVLEGESAEEITTQSANATNSSNGTAPSTESDSNGTLKMPFFLESFKGQW